MKLWILKNDVKGAVYGKEGGRINIYMPPTMFSKFKKAELFAHVECDTLEGGLFCLLRALKDKHPDAEIRRGSFMNWVNKQCEFYFEVLKGATNEQTKKEN